MKKKKEWTAILRTTAYSTAGLTKDDVVKQLVEMLKEVGKSDDKKIKLWIEDRFLLETTLIE